jgi:hypothetical protein
LNLGRKPALKSVSPSAREECFVVISTESGDVHKGTVGEDNARLLFARFAMPNKLHVCLSIMMNS